MDIYHVRPYHQFQVEMAEAKKPPNGDSGNEKNWFHVSESHNGNYHRRSMESVDRTRAQLPWPTDCSLVPDKVLVASYGSSTETVV